MSSPSLSLSWLFDLSFSVIALHIGKEEHRRQREQGPGIAEHFAHAIKLAGRFS